MLVVAPDAPDDRRMRITYDTRIQRQAYTLRFTAVDREGSRREISVAVPMTTGFYEEIGGELVPLAAGAVLADTSRLAVTLRCGAQLGTPAQVGNVVHLRAGGQTVALASADLLAEPGQPFQWTLHYGRLSGFNGVTDLEFAVTQWDGTERVVAQREVEVGTDELRFDHAWWIPNPFQDESTLVYELSLPAARVRLRVFTISGREIYKEDGLPASKGVRHVRWDGRDGDGDAVANGLYFYELTAWDAAGHEAARILEKVVRAR
jgi:hypothetical protein